MKLMKLSNMNLLHDVSLGKKVPDEINVIIEIPRGSLNKYEIDKETGLIALDRVAHASMPFPTDYGFAPQTLWDDGDALDVIVLTTEPLYPGILVSVRPVAIMHMVDSGEPDDKIIGVPVDDPRWGDVHDVGDLNKHTLKTLKHFYENYKKLQDKEVTISGFDGKDAAREAVKRAMQMYRENMGK